METNQTTPAPKTGDLLILDGTAMLFRAYYSISYQGPDGTEVGALLGVSQELGRIMRRLQARHVLIAFDAGQKTFRNEIDPRYKANRGAPPESLIPQFSLVREMVEALGFWSLMKVGFEADDLMATGATLARKANMHTRVRALDKDLWQLVDDRYPGTTLEDPRTGATVRESDVLRRFLVPVERLHDYFSLVGDSSDNIPGGAGIGPKAAAAIMGHYPSLDAMFQRLGELASLEVRGAKTLEKKVMLSHDEIRLAQKLIALRHDVEMGVSEHDIVSQSIWKGPNPEKSHDFFQRMGFQGGYPMLEQLAQSYSP